jgi:DNA-binding MarR family transcriptional regulator
MKQRQNTPTVEPPADTDRLAGELERRMAGLWAAVLRPSFQELSRTATSVLARLRDGGPQRITALAAAEAVAQPTMTTLVQRLERGGLVQRRADAADGRAVLVAVTDDGLHALRRFRERRTAELGARLAALDAADRAALEAALPALDRLIATREDTRR